MKNKYFTNLEVYGVRHVIPLENISYEMYRNKIKAIHGDVCGDKFITKTLLLNSAPLEILNSFDLIVVPDMNYGADNYKFGYRRVVIRKK